jgi:hypothetical protein
MLVCDRVLLDEGSGLVQLPLVEEWESKSFCPSPLLVIGCGGVEHQPRPRTEASDHLGSCQAIEVRHADVEQHGVGVVLRHQSDSLYPITCFTNDGHMRKEAKQRAKQLAENGIVVCKDDARGRG